MNRRTRTYLRGRFRDYYRRYEPQTESTRGRPITPPAPTHREWAYVPFAEGDGLAMVRHQSLQPGESLGTFLARNRPRHVYYSTARYDDPSNRSMDAKGWRGADLVFDLDADHLPNVDAKADSLRSMLAACRDETVQLVDILQRDFGFEDLFVVFSGNRGFHVHVRAAEPRRLDQAARREIVDYVRAAGLVVDEIISKETITGPTGSVSRRVLQVDGGWGRRIHKQLLAFCEELRDLPEDCALERLESFEGIGSTRSTAILEVVTSRWSSLQAGNIDLHPAFIRFVRTFIEQNVIEAGPAIDDPVTTDIHRLIRLPGSIHGSSGLLVQPIDPGALESFEPLTEAIVPMFRSNTIAVDLVDATDLELGGESWTVGSGRQVLPEYVAVFLMARGVAEKVRE